MLEEKENFIKFMKSQPFLTWINVFIWEENIIPFLKDYTIIVKNIKIGWKDVFLGIIWSLKMNYSFNIIAVDWII